MFIDQSIPPQVICRGGVGENMAAHTLGPNIFSLKMPTYSARLARIPG